MTDMLKTGANPLWNSHLGGGEIRSRFTGFKASWWCFGGMQCRIFPTGWSWTLYDFAVGLVEWRPGGWCSEQFYFLDLTKRIISTCVTGASQERPRLETSKLPDKLNVNQFPVPTLQCYCGLPGHSWPDPTCLLIAGTTWHLHNIISSCIILLRSLVCGMINTGWHLFVHL